MSSLSSPQRRHRLLLLRRRATQRRLELKRQPPAAPRRAASRRVEAFEALAAETRGEARNENKVGARSLIKAKRARGGRDCVQTANRKCSRSTGYRSTYSHTTEYSMHCSIGSEERGRGRENERRRAPRWRRDGCSRTTAPGVLRALGLSAAIARRSLRRRDDAQSSQSQSDSPPLRSAPLKRTRCRLESRLDSTRLDSNRIDSPHVTSESTTRQLSSAQLSS